MTRTKERVTLTLDRDLVEAAGQAVRSGRADSLSGWINQALSEKVARERRLRGLAAAVAAYESEFGKITEAEIDAQRRADRSDALVVRGRRRKSRAKSASKRRAA
jgi:hypothetical protein